MKEYSRAYTGSPGEIPYYAVISPENNALYGRYRDPVSYTHLDVYKRQTSSSVSQEKRPLQGRHRCAQINM